MRFGVETTPPLVFAIMRFKSDKCYLLVSEGIMSRIVKTKTQLEQAKNDGEKEIIVEGELADKLKKSKKVAMLGGAGLAILFSVIGAATVTAPVTGGLSYLAAAPVAALTGLEIAAIVAATSVGLALIVAIFKDYEEIEYSEGRLILRKRLHRGQRASGRVHAGDAQGQTALCRSA